MPKPESFVTLLAEDGFRKLADGEEVQVGDIAIYLDDDGQVDHSALVVELVQGYGFGRKTPWVLSKWGAGPEVRHRYNYGPYSTNVEFYRQKKWI